MSGKQWMKHYPKETKLEAVCLQLEAGLTRAEIAVQLGLRSARVVKTWAHQSRQEGAPARRKFRRGSQAVADE